MLAPTYVTKSLVTASSTSIGSIAQNVVTPVLSCATLDTARRITIVGASILGQPFTIYGLNQFGNPISETITTSTAVAGSGTTTQDFLKVTNVVSTTAISSGGALLGTTTKGGTAWVPIDTTRNPINVSFNLDITSPSTVVIASFETTNDYPAYNPNTGLWNNPNTTTGPQPTISSLGSSVTLDTFGLVTVPFVAWRLTITSSSSSAGSVAASVLQSG